QLVDQEPGSAVRGLVHQPLRQPGGLEVEVALLALGRMAGGSAAAQREDVDHRIAPSIGWRSGLPPVRVGQVLARLGILERYGAAQKRETNDARGETRTPGRRRTAHRERLPRRTGHRARGSANRRTAGTSPRASGSTSPPPGSPAAKPPS